jgi:hypothetical protein
MAWHDQFQVEDERVSGRWLALAFVVMVLAVAMAATPTRSRICSAFWPSVGMLKRMPALAHGDRPRFSTDRG